METTNSILFVCLGNTCRSPMSEAIFRWLLKRDGVLQNWTIDSAGTRDYHVGKNPNPKTMMVLREKGILDYEHKARQINRQDFNKFGLIICMDKYNLEELKTMKPLNSRAQLYRLGEFVEDSEVKDVYDPYFDGQDKAFYSVYEHCFKACSGLLRRLQVEKQNDIHK